MRKGTTSGGLQPRSAATLAGTPAWRPALPVHRPKWGTTTRSLVKVERPVSDFESGRLLLMIDEGRF